MILLLALRVRLSKTTYIYMYMHVIPVPSTVLDRRQAANPTNNGTAQACVDHCVIHEQATAETGGSTPGTAWWYPAGTPGRYATTAPTGTTAFDAWRQLFCARKATRATNCCTSSCECNGPRAWGGWAV